MLPTGFQATVPYLLASVLHHHTFLRQNLSERHPLWTSRMFTSRFQIMGRNQTLMEYFASRVLVGTYRCLATGMTASGVPGNLVIVERLSNLESSLKALETRMAEGFQKMQALFLEQNETMPGEIKKQVLEAVKVDGPQGPSREEFAEFRDGVMQALDLRFSAFQAYLERMMDQVGNARAGVAAASHLSGRSNETSQQQAQKIYSTFSWGGRINVYPQSFRIQELTVKQLWSFWHFGDQATNMMPVSKFGAHNAYKNKKSTQSSYSKLKTIMNELMDTIIENGLLPKNKRFEDLSIEEFDEVYCKAMKIYSAFVYNKKDGKNYKHRPDQVTACAFANKRYDRDKNA